jgi:hypothetical protein
MARLPFLDWYASSAGNVAVQIQQQLMDLQRGVLGGRLEIDLGVSELKVERTKNGIHEVRYRSNDGQNIRPCEIVVYGVGFGIESNHGHNDSYWRNDRYGQSDLSFAGRRVRYVVSGFGDGALVDVFRLTIRDFRYERIFDEMFSRAPKAFFKALNQIRESRDDGNGTLFDKFAELERGAFREVIRSARAELNRRLRSDTAVILNSKHRSFRLGLSTRGSSFSNALLAFLLFRLEAVKYKPGAVQDAEKPLLADVAKRKAYPEWLAKAKVIFRHGTDRKSALKDVQCERAITFLRSRSLSDSGQQIYPPGWWGRYIDPAGTLAIRNTPAPIEYVPPQLRTHATTFVSTLASILQSEIDGRHVRKTGSKPKFRVTLHRLTQFNGKDYFQQVTPYKGRVDSEAGVGRFFPVEGGIVGLACRTGSLVVAKRANEKKFKEIWEVTNLGRSGAKEIKHYVDSLFCCPFFAPESSGPQRVILALFVDSADPRFFNVSTLQTISSACRGFVDLLESLYHEGMFRALPATQIGYKVPPRRLLAPLRTRLEKLGVVFVDATDKGWKQGLTFRRLHSLDLQVGYEDAPRYE